MPTVLITAFGPYPGAPFNPTGPLARALARRRPQSDRMRRVVHVFRTSYAAVEADLPKLMARHRPDVVLMFGLATRTRHVRIETRAANARSVLFPDADGMWPARALISPGAPPRIQGDAPHRRLLAAARRAGVPVRLSRDAGRYLCNYSYWRALEHVRQPGGPRLVQFVHVPLVRRGSARWWRVGRRPTLADLVRAGDAILAALAVAAR